MVKEGFIKFTSMISQGIKKAAETIANFFKELFGVTKVKAKDISFIYNEKLEGSNGNSSSNGSDKDKSNNGNGNSSSVSNGNGSGNGNGNSNNNGNGSNNGNGNNVNHGSNNGNNGLHLGWYKRPDQPNNPGNQDPVDNTSNYEIINYVNDVSLGNPQVLMTSDKNGNYTGAYTYGLDRISADNLTADSKDNPLYYLYDGRGSVGQLINSNGEIKNSYSYDPFGATDHDGPLGNSKAHYQDYFGFNGEEFNNISGLQYLRARYYEADSGRFLTRDSYMGNTMDPLSLNRYDYALNNPVMNIDPSGHRALEMDDNGGRSLTVLRNGSSGSDVKTLQRMLSDAGFNPGTIDGIFGNNTEKAVRAYQASKGLTVDGIVGKQTWNSLGGKVTTSNSTTLPTGILRQGSTGSAVQKLQQALIAQHYDLGPSGADGIFGNKTEQAVLDFQRDKHLSIDGIYGSQTRGALSEQGKACDGKDYIGSQETGNTGEKKLPQNFVISVGYGGSIGAGIGFTGAGGVAVDAKGNVAGLVSIGGGGTTPAVGAGWQIQITNAKSVESLTAWGIDGGGSATILGVGGGIGYVGSKNSDGTSWSGVVISVGADNVIAPFEAHAYIGYTWEKELTAQQIEEARNEISSRIKWLNTNLPNEIKKKINNLIGGDIFTVN